MATVLITGSSRGIGMSTALVLSRSGHKVYATMRNPEGAPQLRNIIEKEGLPIKIIALDVDSDSSVKNAFEEILKNGETIDVLVNNAGIESDGSIEETDFAVFKAVMETNYFGPLRCIKAVLPHMRSRKSGKIINITSVAGRISAPPLGAYSASKFALEAISECLAQEVKSHNVQVAVVQPGIIDTAMARRISAPTEISKYPHSKRFAGLFSASLQNPTSSELVAEKILEIIESDSQQFRHPVGPDAIPFLQWRAAMTDEQWVEWGSVDDESWYQNVERDFGLNARPKEEALLTN